MSVIVGSRHVVIPATGLRVSAPRSAAAPGWWVVAGKTCVAAYQPIGAASLAASYSNLAQPGTYDAAPGVAPSWAAGTGWTFNGTSQYITTGVVPINDQTWSLLIRYSGFVPKSSYQSPGGLIEDNRMFGIETPTIGDPLTYYESGFYAGHAGDMGAAGVIGIAGAAGYLDGIWRIAIPARAGAFSRALYLAGRNNGSAIELFAGSLQAVAIYSETLSAPQVATVSAAMAAL